MMQNCPLFTASLCWKNAIQYILAALILATKATIDLDFLGERSLQQELAEVGFAAEKPSLFVAEGLIMYLGPEGILSSSSVRAKTDEIG